MDATQEEDLSTSHDMINECTPEQWSDFEDHIKMLEDVDRDNIADRLGIQHETSWEDYCKAFSDFEWYQFIEAYHHAVYRDY